MSISDLIRMDWGRQVPNSEGDLDGDNMRNLSHLLERIKELKDPKEKSLLEMKCRRFASLQVDGLDIVKIGRIVKDAFKDAKQKFISFNDGEMMVNYFELAALKKDYPHFSESNLTKISSDEYKSLIKILYPQKEINIQSIDQDKLQEVLAKLNIDDPSIIIKYSDNIPSKAEIDACSVKYLPRIVDEILNKHAGDLSDEARDALDAVSDRIKRMNPKNREDVDVAAKLYKILIQNYSLSIHDDFKAASDFLSITTANSKNSNVLTKLIRSLAAFLNESFLKGFDADREFIVNVLKDIPNMYLEFKEEVPVEILDVLKAMDNIEILTFPINVSDKYTQILNERFEGKIRYRNPS